MVQGRAAVLRAVNEPLTIETVDFDDPGPEEVLIRTAAVGVCHSDLHFIEGSYSCDLPVVPGHESSGVVLAVGSDVNYVQPGDHVITCMSAFCGECRRCTSGRPYMCEDPGVDRSASDPPRLSSNGERLHQLYDLSSYADHLLVHERTVVKIRKDMPLDRAALIGCAVVTGFGAVTRTVDVEIGSSVVVIGCGGIGLSAICGAVAAGAGQIVAVDVENTKLDKALDFGATHVLNSREVDVVTSVRELTTGGADYTFEAVGLKSTAEEAFAMLRPGGTAVIIGMVPEQQKIEITASELLYEKTLTGSNMGSNRFRVDMTNLVELYMRGRLPLDDMISRRVGLNDINEAFVEMKNGAVARSVIVFNEGDKQ
ncbi:MAG: Zn-dependent alcohol dehydrogenase [Acidimicrobiales bacterium]|nr:Zn-dependent alcohol dehydrogenase [Acidimicrobiales bacterium]RZV44517.1 MAG: Zn-dependent alcohol dehydrogenase [Acidimicrobiales bacterium]